MAYPFSEIEQKWQRLWDEQKVFITPKDTSKPKYYVLDMFPYPSGAGLHVGHPEGYTATDIMARYKRMRGFHVLHPMGWDAFGLPAERYAMQTGIHPAKTTAENIDNFRRQLKAIGFSYDWEREINTTTPDYYKHTQWIFLKIFNSWYDEERNRARPIEELSVPSELNESEKREYIDSKRLAYIAEIPVNWCAELGTVLANEEVDEWTSKGYTVERRPMRQWMLRITAYAERLLEDLKLVDWPTGTLELQKNWIGKSAGALIYFNETGTGNRITVFTTRPDTLYGVTYVVLAPEHPLLAEIVSSQQKTAVEDYRQATALKSEMDRQLEAGRGIKSGVFTGAYVEHPITGEKIQVWTSDYVLMGYGTGAVMAVPAHDQRDYEFAKEFSLPVKKVVAAVGETEPADAAFTDDGIAVNSPWIDGLPSDKAREVMLQRLEDSGKGASKIQYKLRDWLFSRQRYWGEPIPISFAEDGEMLTETELPLRLPDSDNFQPAQTGESPLANLKEWVEHQKNGKKWVRETNTMPQWAGSCWYYLRYTDPFNDKEIISKENENYWLKNGVDLYVGGAEHAVLHLLYARFWHKVLYDYGIVSYPEPFRKLVHQGIILGEDNVKMSKSRGNVVNPDSVLEKYGADALRLFEMFLGPLEAMKPWSSTGIEGVYRFLAKVYRRFIPEGAWNAAIAEEPLEARKTEIDFLLHSTIRKVTEDVERMAFNTAIAQMMIFLNETAAEEPIGRDAVESFVLLLSPFAPHLSEEIWQAMGKTQTLAYEPWPVYDPEKIIVNDVTMAFQVNGKLRATVKVPADLTDDAVTQIAVSNPQVQKFTEGKTVRKIIVVKNKIVNIVVG